MMKKGEVLAKWNRRSDTAPPLGFVGTVLLFSGFGLLLFVKTHVLIPALAARTRIEPILL